LIGHKESLEFCRRPHVDFPEGEAIFREAADAFRIALYYQALAGGSQATLERWGGSINCC